MTHLSGIIVFPAEHSELIFGNHLSMSLGGLFHGQTFLFLEVLPFLGMPLLDMIQYVIVQSWAFKQQIWHSQQNGIWLGCFMVKQLV